MAWLEKAWRWGVVLPVTLAALAGAGADVITGSLNFWWLLAPSYFVIGVGVWRRLGPRPLRWYRMTRLTQGQVGNQAPGAGPAKAVVRSEDDPPETDQAIVSQPKPVSVWGLIVGLGNAILRVIFAIAFTLMILVLIWGAIDIATWGRGYWYIYGPVLALLAWFAWAVWRTPDPEAAEEPQEPVVR